MSQQHFGARSSDVKRNDADTRAESRPLAEPAPMVEPWFETLERAGWFSVAR